MRDLVVLAKLRWSRLVAAERVNVELNAMWQQHRMEGFTCANKSAKHERVAPATSVKRYAAQCVTLVTASATCA